jgi:hypothetical protein
MPLNRLVILLASLVNGKKIDSSFGVIPKPVERGGKINWRDRWNPDFGFGHLTPAAFARPAPHGTSPSVAALRRKAAEQSAALDVQAWFDLRQLAVELGKLQ